MTEQALAWPWRPVPDVTDAFASISASYGPSSPTRTATVTLHGSRDLRLVFSRVIAMHAEDECPGTFPLPKELPRLDAQYTFPLLTVANSKWASQWPMHPQNVHYVLISLDDIVHVFAGPNVEATWGDGHAA